MVETDGITYYDRIADLYDEMLDCESLNAAVRDSVRNYFVSEIPSGPVLDFGGGTGADHTWLITAGYKVFLYEPSKAMREKAIKRSMSAGYQINVLSYQDLLNPSEDAQAGAVLANFAVLNCIGSLNDPFQLLSKVLHPGDHLIAVVLNPATSLLLKDHFTSLIRKWITGRKILLRPGSGSISTLAYLHTMNDFQQASSRWFTIHKKLLLPGKRFLLIDFVRNMKEVHITKEVSE